MAHTFCIVFAEKQENKGSELETNVTKKKPTETKILCYFNLPPVVAVDVPVPLGQN